MNGAKCVNTHQAGNAPSKEKHKTIAGSLRYKNIEWRQKAAKGGVQRFEDRLCLNIRCSSTLQ